MLLCDIDQYLFRGIIRNSDDEPYTYYLFASYREYKELFSMLSDRYGEERVQITRRKLSKSELFMEWHDELEDGHRYTTQDIRSVVDCEEGVSPVALFQRDKSVLELLRKETIGKVKYEKGKQNES